jgi:hypothetical protein
VVVKETVSIDLHSRSPIASAARAMLDDHGRAGHST